HVTDVGELDLPSVDHLDREHLVAYPQPSHRALPLRFHVRVQLVITWCQKVRYHHPQATATLGTRELLDTRRERHRPGRVIGHKRLRQHLAQQSVEGRTPRPGG